MDQVKQQQHENEREEVQFQDDLASFVNREFDRRQDERRPFELQMRLNTEFISGNQFLDINSQHNKINEVPKMYWWQEREVFNQMATIVETRIARLTRQEPTMKSRPATSSNEDFHSSKITSSLLNMKWHDEKMSQKYLDLVTLLEHHGTVFIKDTWNAEKGRKIATIMQQEMVEDEGFEVPVQKPVDIHEGDIESDIVSALEIYPDSIGRSHISDNRSIIHARAFHIYDIEDMYGVQVDAEDIDSYGMESGSGIGGLTYTSGTFRTTNKKMEKHALVKEYYEKPSKQFPDGRLIIVCGDKVLHEGKMPYQVGEDGEVDFPFTHICAIKIPNRFFGQCVAERCIPLQRRYNALRNRKAEYLNRVAIGQWFEPEGSLDDDEELNSAPGNVIRYNAGIGAPTPVDFPNLPASFENEESSLLQEFTSISGVSELSRYSEAPSGVKSGVALSIANEQDDTRIALTANQIAEGVKETGIRWLRLYRQFAKEPRILRYVGNDSDIQEWTASDLKADDIIIENSSALAETPAQRRQMVFELMGTGIFNRPDNNPYSEEGVQKILELLEYGHWENGIENEHHLHRQKAQRENIMFKQGGFKEPDHFDDHEAHLSEHNKFRLSPEYEELAQSPEGMQIKQMIDYHISQHAMVIQQQQQMMAQMQMQQPMQQQPQEPQESGQPLPQ